MLPERIAVGRLPGDLHATRLSKRLHELLHALHAQYLPNGVGNSDVLRFYNNAVRGKLYPAGEYVLKNHKEFFAEMTESYFGVNDFFPFNRAELKEAEPEIYALLKDVWESPPKKENP